VRLRVAVALQKKEIVRLVLVRNTGAEYSGRFSEALLEGAERVSVGREPDSDFAAVREALVEGAERVSVGRELVVAAVGEDPRQRQPTGLDDLKTPQRIRTNKKSVPAYNENFNAARMIVQSSEMPT